MGVLNCRTNLYFYKNISYVMKMQDSTDLQFIFTFFLAFNIAKYFTKFGGSNLKPSSPLVHIHWELLLGRLVL